MDPEKKKRALEVATKRAEELVNEWLDETRGMPVGFQITQLGLKLADTLYSNATQMGNRCWNLAIEECRKKVIGPLEKVLNESQVVDHDSVERLIEAWGKDFDELKIDEKGDLFDATESQN